MQKKLGLAVNRPLRSGNNDCDIVTANCNKSVVTIEELLVSQYNQEFNENVSEEKLEMS